MPAYLWYPGSAWNGPACLSRSSALNPPGEFASPDFTIGSLVDGKSNLFSPQSHDPGYAAASSLAATNSPFPAFQVTLFPDDVRRAGVREPLATTLRLPKRSRDRSNADLNCA